MTCQSTRGEQPTDVFLGGLKWWDTMGWDTRLGKVDRSACFSPEQLGNGESTTRLSEVKVVT